MKFLPKEVGYYGVDNDEKALNFAQERGAKFFKIDIDTQSLPFEDRKFNIILATEILEHLKDPGKLILQIKCSVKKHGVVLISLPNECTVYHRIKVLFSKAVVNLGLDNWPEMVEQTKNLKFTKRQF